MFQLDDIEDHNIDDIEDINIIRVPKKYVRDMENPLEKYSEVEFKKRFRFNKDSVINAILPKIQNNLIKYNNRGLPISPVIQLLVCLRFFATASFQLVIADLAYLSQSTISRIIFRVSTLLAGELNNFIKMPINFEQRVENRQLFRELGAGRDGIGLPGIDGAIDCTHVRLVGTRFQEFQEVYRNRKGYFSLNVQAVVGPRMEFLDIVPEWPGSQHDSRIFQNLRIYMRYLEGSINGALVGDAGYPSLPFLFTPIRNPTTEAENRYNNVQSKTRRIVEQTFGVWKRRFPCLSKGLGNKLICSTTIVVACAVLHNMALIFDQVLPDDDDIEENNDDDEVMPVVQPHWQPGEGFVVRQNLINRLFI